MLTKPATKSVLLPQKQPTEVFKSLLYLHILYNIVML